MGHYPAPAISLTVSAAAIHFKQDSIYQGAYRCHIHPPLPLQRKPHPLHSLPIPPTHICLCLTHLHLLSQIELETFQAPLLRLFFRHNSVLVRMRGSWMPLSIWISGYYFTSLCANRIEYSLRRECSSRHLWLIWFLCSFFFSN